jgi:hypothetical protein
MGARYPRSVPRALALALATAALALTAAAPASAVTPSLKKSIWGPVTVDGRSQFPIYRDLGVGIWQANLHWNGVATARPANPRDPADPAYSWPSELDTAVSEAGKYGIRISLEIIGAPGWANGGREWNWAPKNPKDFADFAAAAARRYPSVHLWMIWGEPSKQQNFLPMTPETRGRVGLTAKQARAPKLYARMLDASYSALKGVSKRNLVIGGNTYTVGEISPYNWIRTMRLPNGRRPRMDLYGHNPFTSRRPDLRKAPPRAPGPDRNYSDFSDLDTLWVVLDHNGYRTPSGGKLRVFVSEWFLPTDHANWEFPFHVSRSVQASWLTAALKITRRSSRIYTLGWFSLYDDPPRRDHLEVARGLLERDGTRKPAYQTFRRG